MKFRIGKYDFITGWDIALQVVGYIAFKKHYYDEGFLFLSTSIMLMTMAQSVIIINRIKTFIVGDGSHLPQYTEQGNKHPNSESEDNKNDE